MAFREDQTQPEGKLCSEIEGIQLAHNYNYKLEVSSKQVCSLDAMPCIEESP